MRTGSPSSYRKSKTPARSKGKPLLRAFFYAQMPAKRRREIILQMEYVMLGTKIFEIP